MDLISWRILFHNFGAAKDNAISCFREIFLKLWICSFNLLVVLCSQDGL